jgi:flagellar biogenesis protein FliO
VVFPALGMLVLILLVTWLVIRIRRNRPLDREQQLLHV